MAQLKSCPFCGGKGNLATSYSRKLEIHFVWVQCDFCGSRGKTYASPKDPGEYDWKTDGCIKAIEAWNKRAEPEEIYFL